MNLAMAPQVHGRQMMRTQQAGHPAAITKEI
jgi:hypothetical protein